MFRPFATIVAFLMLLAWAPSASAFPNPNSPSKIKLPIPEGSGLVIASSGAPRKCVSKVSELVIAPAGLGMNKGITAGMTLDNYAIKSDFKTHQGNVNVLVLPEGDYQFYTYILNPYMYVVKAYRGQFSVVAGETVYIGELFLSQGCGPPAVIDVRDQEERDFAFLKTLRPDIAAMPYVKRLAFFDGSEVPQR